MTAPHLLPEPRRRCQEVAQALGDCGTVIWLFPQYVSPNRAISAVIEICSQSLTCRALSLSQDDSLPGECLSEALGLAVQRSLATDVRAEQILERIQDKVDLLVIKGVDLLSRDVLEAWVAFVDEWVTVARTMQAKGGFPASMLIPSQNPELWQLVSEDVNLSIHWYWGWLGELEMQLLARDYMREVSPLGADGELLWLESVALGLAGSDADLLFWLLHNGDRARDVEDLMELLRVYAIDRHQWSDQNMRLFQERFNGSGYWQHEGTGLHPPQTQLALWSDGILDWQAGRGVVVHSAAIAFTGDFLELQHRIWREHARVLLPALDRMRLDVCRYLDHSFPQWRGYCESRAEGYLSHDHLPAGEWEPVAEFTCILEFLNTRERHDSAWRTFTDLIYSARDARNRLAHYTPLSRDQFITILQHIRQLRILMGSLP